MPTYDYRCEKGHVFELFHGIKDETPRTCPKCGKSAKRVPGGGGGLLFKGSGFYITDYRSKHYKERAQSEKSAAGKPPAADKPAGGSKPTGGE